MSNRDLARRAKAEIKFNGTDITSSIGPYLLSLTYIDNEEDETDDLQIKLQDRDGVWLKSWLQQAVHASASTYGQNSKGSSGSSGSVNGVVTAGTKLILEDVAGYVSSDADSSYGNVNGTYYAWDDEVILDRIRITNTPERVGVIGQVTCWINFIDAVAVVGGSPNSTPSNVKKGFSISAAIARLNQNSDGKDTVLECGAFELDGVDVSWPPNTITIKATSLPFTARIRQTKKTKAWESYHLSGIANEMANRNGLSCMYLSSKNPFYKRTEQWAVSDIAFLSKLCHNAGISLKVTNNILVLFDQSEYEKRPEIITVKHGDGSYIRYKLGTENAKTQYSSCRVRYTNPDNGILIEGIAKVEDYDEESSTNQQLEVREKVSSIAEAKTLAAKKLRLHNKFAKTVSFTFPGNTSYLAGVAIKLSGWGLWSGKYIICQAKHTIGNSGYTTEITARAVLGGY